MSEVTRVDKERSALSEQLVYEFHRLVFSANN
ncbi:transcriptional regulator, partial [Mobiluncus curtisii]|nr:transcriptional regulator [Mobiluncus curtisii]